ncbi:MAG: zinc ribbon domain-containing protein [bacterium]|nr:zinc ribbon domain-containing protein [bacterium]
MNQEPDSNEIQATTAHPADVACDICGAAVFWKPGAQALACDHCGNSQEVERLDGQVLERTLAEGRRMVAQAAEQGLGTKNQALACRNCGARVLLVAHEISTHCAFCGSGQVLPEESMSRAIQPESVIPLKMPRAEVSEAFRSWLGGLWFRPSALKKLKAFDARGIYVPAWTFDAQAASSWTAQAGYYYYVTKTYTVRVNGRRQTRTKQVRKIRWKHAAGRRRDAFDDLQVMASRGIDRELALELGPFETRALVPYQADYLVGWQAEEYAVDLNAGWRLGAARMRNEQTNRCSGDVPGDTQRNLRVDTQLSGVHWKHVLLPIWSLTYEYGGKTYAVLVNGQSGQVAGKAPYSWVKILAAVALGAAIGGGVAVLGNGR